MIVPCSKLATKKWHNYSSAPAFVPAALNFHEHGPVGIAALVAQAVVLSEWGGGYMDECGTVAVLKLGANRYVR
jgi:hypothetical protein